MSTTHRHAESLLLVPASISFLAKAIKASFANQQYRMFPESVTFLVPEKMAGGE